MAERFQLPLPFWRMQYQLLGGHRKVWLVTLAYVAIVIAGAVAFQRMMRSSPLSQACAWIANGLLAIQVFLILVGGSNSIHRALLRDYETKMTESHRLTPMSNVGMVLGYLIGPNLQVLILFAVTMILGLIVTALGQMPLLPWVVGHLFLLCAASTVWAIIVFSGMRAAKPINPSWIIFAIGGLTVPIAVIPGTGLMLGVYTVMLSIFVVTGQVSESVAGIYVIAQVSLVFAVFWLLAAAAKYRRPDLPAINGARGFALLLLWLFIATGGLLGFQAAVKAGFKLDFAEGELNIQWIGTLIVTLLFTTIATLGATECRLAIGDGRQARGWGDRLPDGWVAVGSAVVACGALALLAHSIWSKLNPVDPRWGHWENRWGLEAWCATTAAFALGTLTSRAIYFVAKARSKIKSPLILTWTLLIVYWSLPAVDSVRAYAVTDVRTPLSYSLLSTASPVGVITTLWTNTPTPIWTGLGCQAAVLVVITLLSHRARRRPSD